MNFENINNVITELHRTTPDDIHGVGLGYKVINNIQSDKLSVIFSVLQKKTLSEILENQILPTGVLIDGIMYPTDVVQVETPKALACYNWSGGTCPQNINCPSQIAMHRTRTRPLKGGINICNWTDFYNPASGTISVGTLGAIVVDNNDQSFIGLTNNHVIIKDAFRPNDQDFRLPIFYNIEPIKNILQWTEGQPINTGINGPNSIGTVKRYYPISESGYNYIDAAIVAINKTNISGELISLAESYKQVQLPYNSQMAFATTQEINSLLTSPRTIYSAGRTTGPKGFSECQLEITEISAATSIYYTQQDKEILTDWSNLIKFKNSNNSNYPIYKGDSGSVLIADFDGIWKIIGLCFAGSTTFGYACRIDLVSSLLNIGGWNGSNKNYTNFYNYETLEINVDEALNDMGNLDTSTWTINKTISGKTYWYAGLKSESGCDGVVCESGFSVDLSSCECAPDMFTGLVPDDLEPVAIQCNGESLIFNGYAFYVTAGQDQSVSIPPGYQLQSPCGGGHRCNRTDFLPSLRVGNQRYPAASGISLNNKNDGGPRQDTFQIIVPNNEDLITGKPKIILECINEPCHNGVTFVALTVEDELVFKGCLFPGQLSKEIPVVCNNCTDFQMVDEIHWYDECPTKCGAPCFGACSDMSCPEEFVVFQVRSSGFLPKCMRGGAIPVADVVCSFDDYGKVTGSGGFGLQCDETDKCKSCTVTGEVITSVESGQGTESGKIVLVVEVSGHNAYWGGPYGADARVNFSFKPPIRI